MNKLVTCCHRTGKGHDTAQSCLFVQDSARRIAKVSAEAKLSVEEEDYVESFKPQMMDVVFAWANGSTFAEICKMTDVFEGKRS